MTVQHRPDSCSWTAACNAASDLAGLLEIRLSAISNAQGKVILPAQRLFVALVGLVRVG